MKTSNRQLGGGSSGMHPERREKLDAVKCDNLEPHPLSVKIYGAPKPSKELLDSIEKHGLLQPIIINGAGGDYEFTYKGDNLRPTLLGSPFQIIAGHTRAAAWRMLLEEKRIKSSWIPCRILHLSPLEGERLIIESNRQRVKTKGMVARETAALVRIETALAKERMTLGAKSAQPRGGKTTEIVARKTQQSNRTVEKQVALVTAADAGNKVARQALAELDENKTSVSAAYRAVVPQKSSLQNSPMGQRVTALETIARKLPNDLRDRANKEHREEAIKRIRAAAAALLQCVDAVTTR